MLVAYNKPFNVLSQFTDKEGRATLAGDIHLPRLRAAGRLDYDSEGLLLLTDDGRLQAHIADPRHKLPKTYWVQVEGIPDEASLEPLRNGVMLSDGRTRPAQARVIAAPVLWLRNPPIRIRKNIPTSWIELTVTEGRNRQVRRMTASIGFPTLRLVRVAIGPYRLESLQPGEWREVDAALIQSFHGDLETQCSSGGDRRARRSVPAGRRGGRRPGRSQSARRPSR